MKRKNIKTIDDMLVHIQEHLCEWMEFEKDALMTNIGELTDFDRGLSKGSYEAYDQICGYVTCLLKDGYANIKVEDLGYIND